MSDKMIDTENATTLRVEKLRTGGYCKRCGREHWLEAGDALFECEKLMNSLDRLKTIDLFSSRPVKSEELTTAQLFGPARGKMFGVLKCLKKDGTPLTLYGFSGQYNGLWQVDGWVPPLFDLGDFIALTAEKELQIKELGKEINRYPPHSKGWLAKRKMRRQLSRQLMLDIHSLYQLSNFRGETVTLKKAFYGGSGIPTGTADCCAPKLLNFAARNSLRPQGIAEFFWGRENRSKGHSHGSFSSSCKEKCQPILGFMLCGLEDS